jgi:hypothetical protein
MTNETLLLRKTKKEIEKRHIANRYVHACRVVVEEAKGRYFDIADIFELPNVIPATLVCSMDAVKLVCGVFRSAPCG